MTDLREELARALYARHKYKHDWDSCKNACRKRAFLNEADALLPIIARVRAEERERCAKVAENDVGFPTAPPLWMRVRWLFVSTHRFGDAVSRVTAKHIAAAIRALGDE